MTDDKPLINSNTEKAVAAFIDTPSHGLLLSGPCGVGLSTVAGYIGRRVAAEADILTIEPNDKDKISIEAAGELIAKLRFVRKGQPLAVIIDEADKLTKPAEHALLKSLEEPVEGVHLILTAHNPDSLLPTIRSRLGQIDVRPISPEASRRFLEQLGDFDAAKTRQLLFIGSGLPAELTRLTTDGDYFERRAKLVADAKRFLGSSLYEQLQVISAYDKDRSQAIRLVGCLLDLLKYSLLSNHETAQLAKAAQAEKTLNNLHYNGHVKTQLAALAAAWR